MALRDNFKNYTKDWSESDWKKQELRGMQMEARRNPLQKTPREIQLAEEKKFRETGESAIPEFIYTIHAATKGMDEQNKSAYMQQFRDRMAQRLQRYEWRKARGAELSPEQEQTYTNLLEKIQQLNNFMEAPQEMMQYMEGVGSYITPQMGVQKDFDLSQIIPDKVDKGIPEEFGPISKGIALQAHKDRLQSPLPLL